jgi:hypothetical protein
VTGNAWSFGEECLCFRDPDGLELALIEEATETAPKDQVTEEPADRAIRRIRQRISAHAPALTRNGALYYE